MARYTPEEYVEADGGLCPSCGSHNITSTGNVEINCNLAYQNIMCKECNAEWTDDYKLMGYSELEEDSE